MRAVASRKGRSRKRIEISFHNVTFYRTITLEIHWHQLIILLFYALLHAHKWRSSESQRDATANDNVHSANEIAVNKLKYARCVHRERYKEIATKTLLSGTHPFVYIELKQKEQRRVHAQRAVRYIMYACDNVPILAYKLMSRAYAEWYLHAQFRINRENDRHSLLRSVIDTDDLICT